MQPVDPFGLDPPEGSRPPPSRGDKGFLLVFVLIVGGLFAVEIFREVTPARMAVLFFFAFYGLLTVLHEAGHALAAAAVGWRVSRVQLGFGPTLGRPTIGGVDVEIRAFPIVGLVQVAPDRIEGARWKNALIYAAGPGIELLLAAAVATAVGWSTITSPSESWAVVVAQSLCLAALLGAGFNLLPLTLPSGQVTDGMGILRSPFTPRAVFEAMMIGPEIEVAMKDIEADPRGALAGFEALHARHPQVLLIHLGIARALEALGRREEALLRLRQAVQETDPDERPEAEALYIAFRESVSKPAR